MNHIQKIGLMIALFLLLAGVFLHNPLEGYIRSDVIDATPPRPEGMDYFTSQGREWVKEHRAFKTITRSFLNWESFGYRLKMSRDTNPYLLSIKDMISYSVLVMIFGGAWVLVFRSKQGS